MTSSSLVGKDFINRGEEGLKKQIFGELSLTCPLVIQDYPIGSWSGKRKLKRQVGTREKSSV